MKIHAYHRGRIPSKKRWDLVKFTQFINKWKWREVAYTMIAADRDTINRYWSAGEGPGIGGVYLTDNEIAFNWPTGSMCRAEFDTPEEAIEYWEKHIGFEIHELTEPIRR